MKKGITFFSVMISVIALAIITATLVLSVPNIIESSKLRAFASELMMVQTKIQSLNGDYSQYVTEDIIVDISDLTDKTIFQDIAVDNKVLLHKLNLEALSLTKTFYGNGKTAKDVYCVSPENDVVYYLNGYETPDAKYYALNSELMSMVSGKEEVIGNISDNIVFMPSSFVKTTTPVQVKIKIPTTIDISTVNITLDKTEPEISTYTEEDNYYVYTVNTNNWKGNYSITLGYQNNGEVKTAKYEVREFMGVYAFLYSDGEIRFNSTGYINQDKILGGSTVVVQSVNIANSTEIPWSSYAADITAVIIEDTIVPTYTSKWFQDCTNLTTVSNLKNLDTSEVRDISHMFENCSNLTSLDLSFWETPLIQNMASAFKNCALLEEINFSKSTIPVATDVTSLFEGATSLKNLNLSAWNTTIITSFSSMFKGCVNLENVYMSNCYTRSITDVSAMFYDCQNLKLVDMRNATFNNVTAKNEMFSSISTETVIVVKDESSKAFIEEISTQLNGSVKGTILTSEEYEATL